MNGLRILSFGADEAESGGFFSESMSSSHVSHGAGAMLISLICCFLSPLSLSIANIIDKFSIDRRVKTPFSFCALVGVCEIVVAAVELGASPWPHIENKITYLYPVISGTCDGVYLYLYYYSLGHCDASVTVGVMYLYPIVVLILTEIFMSEQLSFLAFLGIGFLLSGAITLSTDLIRIFTRCCCPQSKILHDGEKKKGDKGEIEDESDSEDEEEDNSDEEEDEKEEEEKEKEEEEDDSVCWCPPPPSAWCKKCKKGDKNKKSNKDGVEMEQLPTTSQTPDTTVAPSSSPSFSESSNRSSMSRQRLMPTELEGGDDRQDSSANDKSEGGKDFDVDVSPSPKRDMESEDKSPAPEDEDEKDSKRGEDVDIDFNDKVEEKKVDMKERVLVFLALFGIVVTIGCYEFCLALATAGGMAQFAISGTEVGCQGISALLVLIVSKRARAGFFREVRFNWFYAILKTITTVAAQLLLLVGLMELSPPVASSLCALQPLFVLMFETVFHLSNDTMKQCLTFKLIPMIVIVGGVVCITCDSFLIRTDSSAL